MDLFLRNIDVVAVKKIDELAKEKGMSRNEFLKIQLEKLAVSDATIGERNRFEEALRTVGVALEKTYRMLNEQKKEMNHLKFFLMQLTDVSEDELTNLIESDVIPNE